ncbi:Golgi phosphoprotein 3 GPP34 [Mycobacterium sp. BK558]|nr:Golgi phosphoprotein 3 GPP34 [Mycobacterium sp. BK558]
MTLPQTLPLQLYLLAYDSRRRRFAFDRAKTSRPQWRFEYALRSAIFTELYLDGVITDDDGKLRTVAAVRPSDPLLSAAMSVAADGRMWTDLIRSGGRGAVDGARDELARCGWVQLRRRTLGGSLVEVRDVDLVHALACRVIAALESVLRVSDAEPRSLALGLIAFQAQMPVAEEFLRHEGKRHALHELTEATIEPIHALRTLIKARTAEMRMSGGI